MPAFINSSWGIAGGAESVGGWGRTARRRQALTGSHAFALRARVFPRWMMNEPRAPVEASKAAQWPLLRLYIVKHLAETALQAAHEQGVESESYRT